MESCGDTRHARVGPTKNVVAGAFLPVEIGDTSRAAASGMAKIR